VGTGSGSVSIEFARLGCDVTAVEKDEENFEIAQENIEKFGLADKIRLIFGEMEHINLSNTDSFDVAFFGGTDNLEKSTPWVVCIDENGRYVIPVLNRHRGANEFARLIADGISAEPVITTLYEMQNQIREEEIIQKEDNTGGCA